MIDLDRHMWDHYLASFFILQNVYYIYEIITVYELQEEIIIVYASQEEFAARLSQARS